MPPRFCLTSKKLGMTAAENPNPRGAAVSLRMLRRMRVGTARKRALLKIQYIPLYFPF